MYSALLFRERLELLEPGVPTWTLPVSPAAEKGAAQNLSW